MCKQIKSCLSAVILLLIPGLITAQCMLVPLSLQQRVEQSAYIAQGRVTAQHCFIDSKAGSVNTLNTIEVNAWLKNDPGKTTIYLITEGGVLNNRATIVSPSLQVYKDMEYVFFLQQDAVKKGDAAFQLQHPDALQLMAYADGQGAMSFLKDGYHDMLEKHPVAEQILFSSIARLSGQTAHFIAGRKTSFEQTNPPPSPQCPYPGIMLDPNVTNAGTTDSSDFVTVYDAFCYQPVSITTTDPLNPILAMSTSDLFFINPIQDVVIKIPSIGATGPVYIIGDPQEFLTVKHSEQSVYGTFSGFPQPTRQRYYLRNMNGQGGYTFAFSANVSSAPMKNAFARAVSTLRCATGINFGVSNSVTPVSTVAADGESVVMIENGLPPGELARTTVQLLAGSNASCDHYNTVWYQTESDFQFNETGVNWQYGPGMPGIAEYDFESAALHEIEHATGLAHTRNNADVMYYITSPGIAKRLPGTNDLDGVLAKLSYSITPTCFNPVGSGTPMSLASCSALPVNISNLSGVRLDKSSNQLYWTTYQEQNNRGFAIQRSADARNFATIDFVQGAINSSVTRNYVYKDLQAGEAPWYYRLLITGTDGSTKTSSVAFVPGYKSTDWKVWLVSRQAGIEVYRNPSLKESASFQLYNGSGQLLSQTDITSSNTSIPVDKLATGVYYYRLISDTQTLSGRVIIQ